MVSPVIFKLMILIVLCFQDGKPAESKPIEKKQTVPILKAKIIEIDNLLKASFKEIASNKTTVAKQETADKHMALIDEWCKKQAGEKWDFEVVIDDLVRKDAVIYARVSPPSLLLPFVSATTPLRSHTIWIELRDEQKDIFTIGVKIKVNASVNIAPLGKKPVGVLFVLDDGTPVDRIPILFMLFIGAPALTNEVNRIHVRELPYVCVLEEIELEVVGKVKQENRNKKRK